jgi:hypothetical protein
VNYFPSNSFLIAKISSNQAVSSIKEKNKYNNKKRLYSRSFHYDAVIVFFQNSFLFQVDSRSERICGILCSCLG